MSETQEQKEIRLLKLMRSKSAVTDPAMKAMFQAEIDKILADSKSIR